MDLDLESKVAPPKLILYHVTKPRGFAEIGGCFVLTRGWRSFSRHLLFADPQSTLLLI